MPRRFLSLIFLLGLAGCSAAPPAPPEELLVVLNKADNTASVIDLSTGRSRGTLVTGVAPHEAVGDSLRGRVVVANYGVREHPGASLTVLDVRSMRVAKTIALGRFQRPHGMQFFRDGRRVAVTSEASQSVLVVDLESGEVVSSVPTLQETSHMLVLSPDERRAFVANIGSGTVSVVDLKERKLLGNLPVGRGAEGLDLSPDGSRLWVASRAEDQIVVFDTESLEEVQRIPCPSFPIRVRFTPDGAQVWVSNARSGDVAVFQSSDGSELTRISMELTAKETEERLLHFDLSPVPIGILFSPDGSRAYVANANADVVTVIDAQRRTIIDRLSAGREPDGMAFLSLNRQ